MPRGLEEYSDPIVKVYESIVDEILTNLARHFNVKATGNTAGFEYQTRLLGRLGAIRKETAAIIAAKIRKAEPMIELAVRTAMLDALDGVEPDLKAAAADGLLDDVEMDVDSAIRERLKAYANQARNQLNLVNSNMLAETLNTFRTGVNAAYEAILGAEAGKVILGAETLQAAIRKAVKAMSESGITGFYDAAGRKWSAEAYTRLCMKTTCSNAANQAVMDRNQQYGNDLIWVRTNATARPGCYPWQGKVISMDDRGRTVTDGNGRSVIAYAKSATTYGQPDGIFGCNCHHGPMNVFIPGLSHVRGADQMPDRQENDRKYALTQLQRSLERKVRYAKRDLAMLEAAGADAEAIAGAKAKVTAAQKKVRELVRAHPDELVRDYSREAVYN